jgi:hypothetical protein
MKEATNSIFSVVRAREILNVAFIYFNSSFTYQNGVVRKTYNLAKRGEFKKWILEKILLLIISLITL